MEPTSKKSLDIRITQKRRLFTNRLDLIMPPISAKYLQWRILKNGIPIYESGQATVKYVSLPIRNAIRFLERDDEFTLEAASINEQQTRLLFTLAVEFDFNDEPYPAALIPLDNSSLIGVSETVNLFNNETFDQTFDESHYATLDASGYSKLQILITANEDYNPRILSNINTPLSRTFLDLFERLVLWQRITIDTRRTINNPN